MNDDNLTEWINRSKNGPILSAFSVPKTPSQVKTELGINKFSLKPYLKRRLIRCLNPGRSKGRLYLLTRKAFRLLNRPVPTKKIKFDYGLIGWILASPRQRYVVLKTLSFNSAKLTSEEIRIKSLKSNPCLSRISTKGILKELICKNLVGTEMGADRKRYYWMTGQGESLSGELDQLFP